MWYIVGAVVVVLVLLVIIIVIRKRRREGFVSIVMLRDSPRGLTDADIRGAYRRAFGAEARLERMSPDPTTSAVLAISELFPTIGVIDSRRTYLEPEEIEEIAARCEDQDARNGIGTHTAWVSVDLMGVAAGSLSEKELTAAYALLGRLAAELIDDRCLLLYRPFEQRMGRCVPEAAEMLRAGRISELFGDDDLHAPMFHTEKEGPRIHAAIAEARGRLPEFCNAWQEAKLRGPTMIKGRFITGEGGNEYIWLSVIEEAGAGFRATIENPPIDPGIPKKGSVVVVALDDIVDWAYLDKKGKPQGLFVDRVLMESARG